MKRNAVLAVLKKTGEFSDFETKKFPTKLCTVQSKGDGVYESPTRFLCVVEDVKDDGVVCIYILTPYTAEGARGWFDEWGNTFTHKQIDASNPFPFDTSRVVAWRRIGGKNAK